MSPFVFLGLAMGVALTGFLLLWLRNRQPQSMEAGMREFARELDALSPDGGVDVARRAPAPMAAPPPMTAPPHRRPRTGTRQNRGRNR